ncbi:DUF1802 family protein [Shimazuella sp. AN120528]|uniref:DUF1802 family protein n=1 Tax=Shimazuella soli TaxID=1892854 RepID=UPI001F0D2AA7|nr:DUF1802 family protein [Shimazuella soli]MCH5585639.1 DUF1802 family protein [Shimazuella soli]
MKTNTHIALRDWAVTLDELGKGTQIMLLRKGGIHEETRHFEVTSDNFFLFPAYEHQKAELLKEEYQGNIAKSIETWSPEDEQVIVKYYAELYEDIELLDEEKLKALYPHHIWTNEFAAERLKWKKKLPLHVLLLRVYQLEQPAEIPMLSEYGGCKSWLSLPEIVQGKEAHPVLSDEAFAQKVADIKQSLQAG